MAVAGVGLDLCCIARVSRLHARFGERFLARAFHPLEIREFGEKRRRSEASGAQFLASRWAAKEAAQKALGATESGRLLFPELRVASRRAGAPRLALEGAAARHCERAGLRLDLSISHETDKVAAVCIASWTSQLRPTGRSAGPVADELERAEQRKKEQEQRTGTKSSQGRLWPPTSVPVLLAAVPALDAGPTADELERADQRKKKQALEQWQHAKRL